MIATEKQAETASRKQKIRDRYRGVDPSKLEVRLAKAPEVVAIEDRTLNVAAYIRVSTENDEQTSSFELQYNDFSERIQANPNWNFVGIYADEGISGTELSHVCNAVLRLTKPLYAFVMALGKADCSR